MAVNKNFVVKNGIEVSTDLIHATSSTNKVGIGSTIPGYLLDVGGTLGATNVLVSGATTLTQDLQVGTSGSIFYVSDSSNSVGVGTSVPAWPLHVVSSVSTGQTALYVHGDVRITGDLNVDDINFDDAALDQLYVSGLSTFVGVSTFKSDVWVDGTVINGEDPHVGVNNVGQRMNPTTGIVARSPGTNHLWTGYQVSGTDATSEIKADGSVSFASSVTANEYYGDGSKLENLPGVSLGMVIALSG